MEEAQEITLKDVEIAIKIIEKWLKMQRKTEYILGKLSRYAKRRSLSEKELFFEFVRSQFPQEERELEVTEEELSEEELKRFREYAEKLKKEK